ncbi:MAG: hypothetical protein IJ159_07025 [Prevotella sp.]|nr:hypothetical protein [Prevotella sp.]MBQ9216487.1 hypothetical protein [Prevotella sp.]
MYQSDRGNYKTTESVGKAFTHSCLGKLIILAALIVIGLIIAYFTTPTEKEMTEEMTDNIMQCLQENDSIKGDDIDDNVNNLAFIFTKADTTKIADEVRKAYHMYNRLEIYRHTFYATAHLRNNLHPEGIRVGFGAFGLVIPTVNYKDILLDVGPVHKGYNQKIIPQTITNDVDLGTNPNIQEYHYKRNPND